MKSFIITKWVEPYILLETVKKYYDCVDYTFDGRSKTVEKEKFLNELKSDKNFIGLYMKNVNKFYLLKRSDKFDIVDVLTEIFSLSDGDSYCSEDIEEIFSKVDLAKAEAGIIIQ